MAAMGNADFGYWSGGGNPTVSTVDRLDYSNDTATASPKGPLIAVRQQHAGSSSRMNGNPLKGPGPLEVATSFGAFSRLVSQGDDFGYFGGGNFTPGFTTVSTVDRIDYSNDTATAVVKGPLTAVTAYHSATGNASSGYYAAGGPSSISKVDRIDYSNDTALSLIHI